VQTRKGDNCDALQLEGSLTLCQSFSARITGPQCASIQIKHFSNLFGIQ